MRPRRNYRYVAEIFKCVFLNENVWISLKISPKFVPRVRINHIPALVQIMAWRQPGKKPFSEPILVSLPTHICVTRSHWVNSLAHENPMISQHWFRLWLGHWQDAVSVPFYGVGKRHDMETITAFSYWSFVKGINRSQQMRCRCSFVISFVVSLYNLLKKVTGLKSSYRWF